MLPPACGCECRISATGARGRLPGWKRPSRRPSGPGKMTSGMRCFGSREKLVGRTSAGAQRRRVLYRGGRSCGNRQEFPDLSTQTRIYLDHAATTPVLPEARAAMARGFDAWANPNSPHGEGRAARTLLEEARSAITEALGWRHDVVFTSGASEAVEIAAARARVSCRAHGATEHAIVPF